MNTELALDTTKATLPSYLRRVLRRIPQFTRNSRHFWSLVKHSTPRKLANLLLVETEFRLRKAVVKGYPYIVIIDPLNVCNLRCPLCPTGIGELGRKGQKISWETFTKVIDELSPYAYEVNLHNWGESLLHPHIYEMIEYIGQRNIGTNLSTNFNKISPQNIDKLINSGLEYLILSIDGISQETYSKYRVGGNIETVLDNVKTLVRRRSELQSSTPYIEWQFIVFEHNAHEVEAARKMAAELGINKFRVIPPGLPFDAENPDELRDKWFVKSYSGNNAGSVEEFRNVIDTACLYMYRSFTVNPDGHTAPCCIVYGTNNDFGDINKEDFRSVWNNAKYRSARSQYRANGDVVVPTVCDRCNIFRKKTPPPQHFLSSHSPPHSKNSG